ncbi:carbohydrate esterase family 5 protein [Annulohypoxylon truncatum]|uniref:carbohydrate esterase family 5 protein n=1 Tax=Annulohypoxylon truncatum TaxID=327061 RepID=UPI0020082E78|nr:carbohydrate esterase family 5 protein [Annulohypoxylon truncatum]KAI1215150.1 carbohydrate esterase family 5 protein [Annulohypoxylon truncatum]
MSTPSFLDGGIGLSKMISHISLFLFTCVAVVSALPSSLQPRQSWTIGFYAHELTEFGCRPIIFIWAKATIEPGNLGNTVGPALSDGLKAVFGPANVATQGVDYWGFIETNFYPGGAPPWGIYDMQLLLNSAATCPDSKIVAGGYSQGAALTHRAIEGLTQEVKDKIIGVVTFGDTQTYQDGGRIQGFDTNRTLIICNAGDAVCVGTLYVFPVHFDYVKWVPTAVYYLTNKLLDDATINPWPNGSFIFPNVTVPAIPQVPAPPQPSDAVPMSLPPLPTPIISDI